jgi:hypothetical protein
MENICSSPLMVNRVNETMMMSKPGEMSEISRSEMTSFRRSGLWGRIGAGEEENKREQSFEK